MRVIVGSPSYPHPPTDGDKVRWAALLPALGRLVELHAVFGLMPGREQRNPCFEERFASVDLVRTPYLEVAVRAGLMELGGRPSLFGRRATPAWRERVLAAATREPGVPLLLLGPNAGSVPPLPSPAVLDLLDIRGRARTVNGDRVTRPGVAATERVLAQRFSILLSSESDRQWLLRYGTPQDRVHVVPHGVDARFFLAKPHHTSRTLLFVGNLRYPPNEEGIRWFVRTCWPRVRANAANTVVRIVGYDAKRLGILPGVDVFTNVPDVLPHYAAAAVAIAPLQVARGTQFKVLEAMAAGLPVVCTSPVAEGLFADHPALVCDETESFAQACVFLLGDVRAREELGREGRDYVRRHHEWAASAAMVRDTLRAL